MNNITEVSKPSFKEALRFWSKLGWISFGGTAAHIAIMHDYLVDKRKWISNSKFLHALSLCMMLPGPEAQQLAIYIGRQLHGRKGGLAAGVLFVLPSMFILLGLSIVYVVFGGLPWMSAMFAGLKPAVIALIIIALFKIGQKAIRGPLHLVVAVVGFILMYFLNMSLLTVMAGAIVLAVLIRDLRPSLFHNKKGAEVVDEEDGYYINRHTVSATPDSQGKRLLGLVVTALLIWLVPFLCLFVLARDFQFWKGLSLFFTKTAFVTIGGSYTVIPYVAQFSVVKFHWLTNLQMTDGFALAETTPGPLIIVLAFVGFMAGYNHFGGSIAMGTIALLVTTFYTFLPCFLFVFAGVSVVEKTQGNALIEGILGLITAVVVGAILNLTIFLGTNVLFVNGTPRMGAIDWLSLGWVVISLLLMKVVKMNVVSLILLSVVFGLIRYYFI
jgi:chromate transporter